MKKEEQKEEKKKKKKDSPMWIRAGLKPRVDSEEYISI